MHVVGQILSDTNELVVQAVYPLIQVISHSVYIPVHVVIEFNKFVLYGYIYVFFYLSNFVSNLSSMFLNLVHYFVYILFRYQVSHVTAFIFLPVFHIVPQV